MLSESQARTMLSMQARMNSKVDPDWVSAAYPYMRAVVIEAAEAIEHHGWKWWKRQTLDLPQLQMELIDIWHFMLSEILLVNRGDENKSLLWLMKQTRGNTNNSLTLDGQTYTISELDLLAKLELLIGTAIVRRVELGLFAAIMHDCQLSWHDMYAQYVSKNVLNFFRQDNGYKEGSYRKIWQNREDNEHLVDIMQSLDPADPAYQDLLYAQLTVRYNS